MQTSEQINEIAAALVKAQSVMKAAAKDSTNPHFRSKYADLASIWDACRGPLTDNGLCVVQAPETCDDGAVRLVTRLVHSSGQWIETAMACRPSKPDAQAIGSVVSYLKRYSLAALVGVVADDDDDGNAASSRGDMQPANSRPAPRQQARQAPPKREDEGSPFDDVAAVNAIATDTVPYTASNGREYQMPAADAVAKLWKACEADAVSDVAFEALLAANEPWLMVQARTDLERMRATRGGE